MLFGNGLSALLTLMGISAALVVLFVVGAARARGRTAARAAGSRWLAYFGALGAGFMLIEVAVLQRFVLLLGHPVYSLTVTLFSLLLGTGSAPPGAAGSTTESLRRDGRPSRSLLIAALGVAGDRRRDAAHHLGDSVLADRCGCGIAVAMLVPIGVAAGHPDADRASAAAARARPQMVTWAWGMNGALSVLGATLAIFIAMNWGFQVTLLAASATYLSASPPSAPRLGKRRRVFDRSCRS